MLIMHPPVANKVFSVILFAYIEGLTAIAQASRRRQPQSPVSQSPTLSLNF